MQENPRYVLDAIRPLLSLYLDGALDADQLVEIELMLEDPEVQAELLKLQEARGLLQNVLQTEDKLRFSRVSDTVWKNISHQLQADCQAEVADYDFEFISAYYDGELDSDDPTLLAFEAQLFQNDAANHTLADIGSLSEMLRQFGYRQEEACLIDMTAQVMSAFQEEAANGLDVQSVETATESQVEMLSALIDEELAAKDIIELNRLIEQEPTLKEQLSCFNQISDGVRSIARQLEAQAPNDFWSRIESSVAQSLAQDLKQKGQLVSLPQRSSTFLRRAVAPAAAAILLVLLSIPSLRKSEIESLYPQSGFSEKQVQLASVPMSVTGSGFMRASYQTQDFSPEPLDPVVEPSRKLVSHHNWRTTGRSTGTRPPTSEEYLFQALEEQQLPDVGISNLLGK